MSGAPLTPTPKNRKERRATSKPSVREQQLASLMQKVYDEGKVRRGESESEADYFSRIRSKALQVLRYQRRSARRTVRTSRKRNRRIAR